MRSRPRHLRCGYVLLMVLMLLALAAAAMAGVARMSLQKSVHAGRAEADLRRRWAVSTCRAVLLPKAEAVLAKSARPVDQVKRELRLGDQSFTLLFGDEQAKANINLLFAAGGLSGAERDVRTIVAGSGGGVPVELRPIPGRGKLFGSDNAANDDPPAFESLGQIFPRTSPEMLTAEHGTSPMVVAGLTCWGDGSLNLRRASGAAVRAVCTRYLAAGDVSRLLNERAKSPDSSVSDLLDRLNLPDKKRDAVEDWLTDDSACHSLWIISHDGRRSWYDLAVTTGDAGETTTFRW